MVTPGDRGTNRHDGEAGFSLIALLVVLLALGVMAAMAVAVVNSEQSSVSSVSDVVPGGVATPGAGGLAGPGSNTSLANRAACQASAATIQTAALAYFAGHDATWPADIAALTDATPPYLRNAPDPKWGLVYDNTTGQVDATACSKL